MTTRDRVLEELINNDTYVVHYWEEGEYKVWDTRSLEEAKDLIADLRKESVGTLRVKLYHLRAEQILDMQEGAS